MDANKNNNQAKLANWDRVPEKGSGPKNKSPKKKTNFLVAALIVLVVAVIGLFGLQNQELFRAAILEDEDNVPTGSADFYIPNFEAIAGDTGNISLRTRDSAATQDIHSIQFDLNVNPVNALAFSEGGIVFDSSTTFGSADLKTITTREPGKFTVSFFSNEAVSIGPDETLAKFEVTVNPLLPQGTEIELSTENVEVVVPDPINLFATSSTLNSIDTGSIVLDSQDELRLLNAEAIDGRHVLLTFSDLIVETGEITDYIPGGITISLVERGDARGYGQNTVLLTTSLHNPNTYHTIAIDGDIKSNTQGGIHNDFNDALFLGFGQPSSLLSDFAMDTAQTMGYNTFEVTFSDDVVEASVNAGNFTLTDNLGNSLSIIDASVNGNIATFTTNATSDLIAGRSYILDTDPSGSGSPERVSDGAKLGINSVVFTGFKNGPLVTDIQLDASTQTITITFDEAVEVSAGNFAGLLKLGPAGPDSASLTAANTTVTGNVITGTNINFDYNPNNAYAFGYTDTISSAQSGVAGTQSVGFEASNSALGQLGNITISKKNQLTIAPGSFSYSGLEAGNIIVSAGIVPNPVADLSVDAAGNLVALLTQPLDPGTDYNIYIEGPGGNMLAVDNFRTLEDFTVQDATAVAPNQLLLSLSENVEQASVSAGEFSISSTNHTPLIGSASVQAGFREILVTLVPLEEFQRGTVYTVNTGTNVRSFVGGKALQNNVVVFEGYETGSGLSGTQVASVTTLSRNSVEIEFTGDIDPASVSAINQRIIFINSTNIGELTVTGAELTASNVIELTTETQAEDQNYFIAFEGVKDVRGNFIRSNKMHNFFGFTVSDISVVGITPNTVVNNEDQAIVISGSALDSVVEARLGSAPITLTEQTENSIRFEIAAGLNPGSYDLTLVNSVGEQSVIVDAIIVSQAQTPLQVLSEQSISTPMRVPNDGETEVTLWVQVEDPAGIDEIDSVTINLEQINGPRSQEMTADTSNAAPFRQWYTFTTTVPATVATSAEPYLLPVEVRKGADTFTGTAQIQVSSDVLQSLPPVIEAAFASPTAAAPDGETEVRISAQISDPDGAQTISQVVANLSGIGLGFIPLSPLESAATTGEQTVRFYSSETFTIPTSTQAGNFTLPITATDNTGGSTVGNVEFSVSTSLTGPSINATRSYISPRRSVPRDGTTTFGLNVFVSDPDTLDDIASVTANFGIIGIPPTNLVLSAETDTNARSGWYTIDGLTIPSTAPYAVHPIEVVVADEAGNEAVISMQIDITDRDTLGDPPIIDDERAYTTPRVAVNDGQTPITLYVFVRDDDDDIDSVVVNLGSVGQVGASTNDFSEVGSNADVPTGAPANGCPTNSNVLVCMQPSVREGDLGQWYILPNVVVHESTQPSSTPYEVEVLATDQTGKFRRGMIPVHVNNGGSFTNDAQPPVILAAVATSPNSVEVVFSEEIATSSISSNGGQFAISDRNDITQRLLIDRATINADGTIVTLTTETMEPGKRYVLTGSEDITDAVGVNLVAGTSNRVDLNGFNEASDRAPAAILTTATDSDTVEIEFRGDVRPTSLDESNFEIIATGENGARLGVQRVTVDEDASIVSITTDPQTSNVRYQLSVSGVESAGGIAVPGTINRLFRGFNAPAATSQRVSNSADLNGDGRVDFTDFTMFSAVYGQVFNQAAADAFSGNGNNNIGPSPLDPVPDATVPITSSIPAQ